MTDTKQINKSETEWLQLNDSDSKQINKSETEWLQLNDSY